MLRKNSGGLVPEMGGGQGRRKRPDPPDDGEKGSKIRKENQSKFRGIVVLLGILLLMSMVAIVKYHHKNKNIYSKHYSGGSSQSLRKTRGIKDEGGEGQQGFGQVELHSDFLPPNSIYGLSVLDSNDHMTSLRKFQGLVSLVVNVACL